MPTFHVTDIDSWAWYKKLENMTAKELADRLKRKGLINNKMLMGTAFHSILENPPDEIGTIERDGFPFEVLCDSEIILPQVREIRASKTYMIDGVEVILTGKVDGITHPVVTDHKLTFNFKPENYLSAYQWRAYLDIFEADKFVYYAYHAREKGGVVLITDVLEISVYRYPNMVDDLRRGISGFLEFVNANTPELMQ